MLTIRHIRHWYEPRLPHAVFLDGLFAGMVGKTHVTDTGTDGRGEPLTDEDIYTKTANALEVDGIVGSPLGGTGGVTILAKAPDTGVVTGTDTDEDVVKGLVGLVGTANDFAVLVTIVVLLSGGVHGEEEACSCKGSEDNFDTFHN